MINSVDRGSSVGRERRHQQDKEKILIIMFYFPNVQARGPIASPLKTNLFQTVDLHLMWKRYILNKY